MFAAGGDANIILLCGPTGVGKTTLGRFLIESEVSKQANMLATNPGYIPAIWVEAPASGEKEFPWRRFYRDILNALEGDIDAPRTAYGVDPTTDRVIRPAGSQNNRLADLRKAVEDSLKNRGTSVIVVDEAAHIMQQCHPNGLTLQLNTLKSLSNSSGVQWILLGSYDLFELVSLNAQLARRIQVIHFGRYREDDADDVRAFRGCLKQFGENMPAPKGVDLLRYVEAFHHNTLGCIGTLRNLLIRLDLLVATKGWSEEVLCKALLTEAQVTQIMREILEGEERIAPGLKRELLPPKSPLTKKVA